MRTVIVDDEAPARALLAEFLAAEPRVELVAECRNGFEAVKAVRELDPQILVLDVQMPKLDGFEVLELLDRSPAVIFTTAYDEYAVRAFEVHAVDYLLKPFSSLRFREALDRAVERLVAGTTTPVEKLSREVRRDRAPLERVLVRQAERIRVVPVERIDYIEARGDAVVLRVGKETLRKAVTLGELEEQLDERRFVRVHRSYLLSLDALRGLELYAKDSRVAVLRDGTRLPVSRSGYARLKKLL